MAAQSLSDRNLLFGILALQMDFITQDQLIEGMQNWVFQKDHPLEDLLHAKGFLNESDKNLLSTLVARHIEKHAGQVAVSLESVSTRSVSVASTDPKNLNRPVHDLRTLATLIAPLEELRKIADSDLNQSLDALEPPRLVTPSGGSPTLSLQLPDYQAGLRYQTLRPHAKGGLGQVFVARDLELDREVALKEIQISHSFDEGSRTRFLAEAEITGKLEHPGIVPIYGLGKYPDGRPFYAMRFIQGETLHDAIRNFYDQAEASQANPYETVAFRKLLRRFVDVCNAVGYAHSRGVLHRDLKPGNVMLGEHGETLVVDWGLAKLNGAPESAISEAAPVHISSSHSNTDQTLPGQAIGTPCYMSPEQADGRADLLSPATDIYGLGATLYSLLTGQKPLPDSDIAETLRRTKKGDIPSAGSMDSRIPRPFVAICEKAMAVSPSARYETCEELADEIERSLAGEPISAYREPWSDRARRWIRKHRTLASSTVAALGVAVVSLVVGLIIVTGLNRQLDTQNDQLQIANAEEQKQRQLAESGEKRVQQLADEKADEAAKATAFSNLLLDLFETTDPIGLGGTGFRDPSESIVELSVLELIQRMAKRREGFSELSPEVRFLFANEVGNALRGLGDPQLAETLLTEAVKITEAKQSSISSSDIAKLQFHLGMLAHDQGKLDLAVKHYNQALELTVGKTANQVLRNQILFRRAWLTGEMGQTQDAYKQFEQVKNRLVQTVNPDHPDVMAAELGMILSIHRRMTPQEMMEFFSGTRTTTLMTLAMSHYLPGRVFRERKLYPQAKETYEKLLVKARESLPKQHPLLGMLLGEMAGTYRDSSRHPSGDPIADRQRGFELAEEAADIARHTIPTHPKAIELFRELGMEYESSGQTERAVAYYEEMVEMLSKRSTRPQTPQWLQEFQSKLANARQKLKQ